MRTRIFLAEDDAEMRRLLVEQLSRDGYELTVASDGADALTCLSRVSRLPPLSQELPDIIVMDVHMPGYSGLHVLTALRRAGWRTPVILITAFGSASLHEQAKTLGASIMLDKPFSLHDLRTALVASLSA